MPTTTRTGRPRDNQKQRLYDAEGSICAYPSAAAKKLLDAGPKVASTGNVSIEACQAYVDHVTTRAWFQRRWGRRRIIVGHKVSGKATWDGSDISLPPWSRTEEVILHEVAHALAPARVAPHGPEFAGILVCLVEHMCGKEAKAALLASFREHRVRRNTSAVPEPTRQVVTAADRAAKARQERDRPLTRREAAEAAAVIRRAATQGLLGNPGTKPREGALTAARALEKHAEEGKAAEAVAARRMVLAIPW